MRWVKESGESERPSVMDGIRAATLPDTKVGRLPRGHSWRENLDKPLYEGEQMTVNDTTVSSTGIVFKFSVTCEAV